MLAKMLFLGIRAFVFLIHFECSFSYFQPTNFGSYESAVNGKDGARFPGDKGNQMKRGIQTSPDGKKLL